MIKAVPIVLVGLLCVSCAHQRGPALTLMQRQAIEYIVQAEEAGSLNQCRVAQIDLTRDGKPESVVIFRVGSHGSQVRVLSWQAEKATVLFENGSNTPNTAFCLVEGVPTIALKRTESAGKARNPSRDPSSVHEQFEDLASSEQ